MTSDHVLKLHLRLVTLGRRVLRVVTLRPGTTARFSTNSFHNTWHILAGCDGAAILARLLWGLSFQRHADTFVVIDREHVVTTPFDGDAADMILLARSGDAIDGDVLRAITLRLRRVPRVDKTIRFHTFGLDGADLESSEDREQVRREHGFLCYRAPIETLRWRATAVHAMRHCAGVRSSFLGEARRYAHASGEVQIFRHFDELVSCARVARRAIVGDREIRDASERERVYDEALRRKNLLWNARAG